MCVKDSEREREKGQNERKKNCKRQNEIMHTQTTRDKDLKIYSVNRRKDRKIEV